MYFNYIQSFEYVLLSQYLINFLIAIMLVSYLKHYCRIFISVRLPVIKDKKNLTYHLNFFLQTADSYSYILFNIYIPIHCRIRIDIV